MKMRNILQKGVHNVTGMFILRIHGNSIVRKYGKLVISYMEIHVKMVYDKRPDRVTGGDADDTGGSHCGGAGWTG